MPLHNRRSAVTLTEVLIVAAVLALLVALAIPAIQWAREAANLQQCGENLRQLGLAARRYHTDHEELIPAGYLGPMRRPLAAAQEAPPVLGGPLAGPPASTLVDPAAVADRGPWTGCLVALLPYLGQEPLYRATATTPSTFGEAWDPGRANAHPLPLLLEVERRAWWEAADNLGVAATRLKGFRCPADTVEAPTSGGVLYAAHSAGGWFWRVPGPDTLGRTNYLGVAGALSEGGGTGLFWDAFEGTTYNRSAVKLTPQGVPDGLSTTLLFGEGLGGSGVGDRTHAWSWFGVGALGTAYGLGRANVPAPVEPPALGAAPPPGQDGAEWYRFGSAHAKVTQFCYADGSVRGFRFDGTTTPDVTKGGINDSAWSVLQQLAGRREGTATPPPIIHRPPPNPEAK